MAYKKLQITLRNEVSEVVRLKQELEGFCSVNGLSERTAFDLQLILEEHVTNVISYGYEAGKVGSIFIRVEYVDPVLDVSIQDDGVSYNPLEREEPSLEMTLDDIPVGGWGVHLMRKLSRSLEYVYQDGCNCLSLVIALRV